MGWLTGIEPATPGVTVLYPVYILYGLAACFPNSFTYIKPLYIRKCLAVH